MLWRAPPTGMRVPWIWELLGSHDLEELPIQTVTTIGRHPPADVPFHSPLPGS